MPVESTIGHGIFLCIKSQLNNDRLLHDKRAISIYESYTATSTYELYTATASR